MQCSCAGLSLLQAETETHLLAQRRSDGCAEVPSWLDTATNTAKRYARVSQRPRTERHRFDCAAPCKCTDHVQSSVPMQQCKRVQVTTWVCVWCARCSGFRGARGLPIASRLDTDSPLQYAGQGTPAGAPRRELNAFLKTRNDWWAKSEDRLILNKGVCVGVPRSAAGVGGVLIFALCVVHLLLYVLRGLIALCVFLCALLVSHTSLPLTAERLCQWLSGVWSAGAVRTDSSRLPWCPQPALPTQ